ncbi:MAG TPA: hypothetical protein VF451_00525 [Acidobacteriota bacterium]
MKIHTAVFLLMAWPLRAGAAQVTMSASTPAATIGERIELRVIVRAEAGVKDIRVAVPAGAYDIIGRSRRPTARAAEGSTFEEIIVIAFFQTGDFTVGPFRVELLPQRAGIASEPTGQLAIRVRSLLGENDKDIKPLKGLFAIRGDPRHLAPTAAALMLLLLLGALLLLLLKKSKKRGQPEAEPPLAPEIELEMRVRELRQKNLPQAGEFRQFFIALSGMIKHFIQRAYGFNAVDCTTAETMARLTGCERDGEIVAGLETIFTEADLVKFARRVPEQEFVAGIWPMIASLVAAHKKRRERTMAATHVQTGR